MKRGVPILILDRSKGTWEERRFTPPAEGHGVRGDTCHERGTRRKGKSAGKEEHGKKMQYRQVACEAEGNKCERALLSIPRTLSHGVLEWHLAMQHIHPAILHTHASPATQLSVCLRDPFVYTRLTHVYIHYLSPNISPSYPSASRTCEPETRGLSFRRLRSCEHVDALADVASAEGAGVDVAMLAAPCTEAQVTARQQEDSLLTLLQHHKGQHRARLYIIAIILQS